MEILQLRYFCDSANAQNFSVTAKKYGVPPSCVSQSIRRLEKELKCELFIRGANSISLSECGKEFYREISDALYTIDSACAMLHKENDSDRLSICINSNRRIVMQAAEKFCKLYPNVELDIIHLDDAASKGADLIISTNIGQLDGYEMTRIISENIAVAIRRDNPVLKKDKLTLKDLSSVPFVTMPKPSSLYNLLFSICRDFGFKPTVSVQSDDPFYVRKCVELGLGAAIFPSVSWHGQFSGDVSIFTLDGYTRETFLYIKKSRLKNSSVKAFIDILTEECESAEV